MSRSEPQDFQRQRKARVEHHVVAELLQVALDTHQQQQDKEVLAHAQRPRRKRAPRRRTRAEKAEGYADTGTQEVTLPEHQVNTLLTVRPEPQQAAVAAQPLKRKKRVSKCKRAVLREREQKREQAAIVSTKFVVRNLVTRDELEDPDERHDLEADTRGMFVKFGALVHLTICGSSDTDPDGLVNDLAAGDVIVEYEDPQSAVSAFAAHDERVFGGRTIACRWLSARGQDSRGVHSTRVCVDHMLTVDELEDNDEFTDVRDDVLELFERYGAVHTLEISRETGAITVAFRDAASARQVVATMHQSVYGGRSVTANLVAVDAVVTPTHDEDELIAGKAPARDKAVHATPTESGVGEVVVSFLKRLASLQERAHEQNPLQSKRSRRFVLGLHEVRRGLLVNKTRLLLVATDVEACGVLDEKLAEIVAIAERQDVPVRFPLTRRQLGRALSKHVRVSCVGIYSFDGANDLFAHILSA